jgi:predicted nucleic-acid-binding Zn-ribbon protein
MVKMKCPKCNGEMKLPVRKSGAIDPATYNDRGGLKLVCKKCRYTALPSEVRQAKKSN